MKKIMTGIKSSGIPHLGNIISVILPTLSYIRKNPLYSFYIMIADLHSLTSYSNSLFFTKHIYINAATWLSFNIKYKNNNIFFYRQSDIKEISELFWYLNCFFPTNRLKLFHSIKKHSLDKNSNINMGIINYPILMASDILLYNINKVIVGRDQCQHIEIARKITTLVNNKIKKKYFKKPSSLIFTKKIVPGINGEKMSKSLNNTINVFSDKDVLEKQIMSIYTTNERINKISYNKVKNTVLLQIYKLLADKNEYFGIKAKIKSNKIGFYEIKKKLFKYILYKFYKERKRFLFYLNNKEIIKKILFLGKNKLKKSSKFRINLIKKVLGIKI